MPNYRHKSAHHKAWLKSDKVKTFCNKCGKRMVLYSIETNRKYISYAFYHCPKCTTRGEVKEVKII